MDYHNRYISENHSKDSWYLMPSDFKGAFAYWVAAQNQNELVNVDKALQAFTKHVNSEFTDAKIPELFSYERINRAVSEDVFIGIPEIVELNEMKPDFIDLGALCRNVFYMICREKITQPI